MLHPAALAALMVTLLIVGSPAPVTAGHVDSDAIRRGCGGGVDCGGGIPSIQRPTFTENAYLADDDLVVGVSVGGDARAYPVNLLDWHEIVNDEVGGEPILVSYCPLCGSAVAFSRVVDGQELTFHVSGFLYQNDLVMWDEETHHLWSQIEGAAIGKWDASGDIGTDHDVLELPIIDSRLSEWGAWREAHPETKLLARPKCGDHTTHPSAGCADSPYQRDYERYPYGDYKTSRREGVGYNERGNVAGFHPKTVVLGIDVEGVARAYPFPVLEVERVVMQSFGDRRVVVTHAATSAQAFDAGTRTFEAAPEGQMRDGDGILWDRRTGEQVDGDATLDVVPGATMFLFAWQDFQPDTTVYTPDGPIDAGPPDRSIPGPSAWATLLSIGLASLLVVFGRRKR